MKHFLLILSFSIISLKTSYSQISLTGSVVLLEFETNKGVSFGTGFFMADKLEDRTFFYLVTARHVLGKFDNTGDLNLHSSTLRILRSGEHSSSNYAVEIINLEKLKQAGLITSSKEVDLIMISMGYLIDGEFFRPNDLDKISFFSSFVPKTYAIPKHDTFKSDYIVIGQDIFISGYPKTIGLEKSPQYDYTKPLVRKGIISGFYPENSTLILDTQVMGGFSGSPVFIKDDMYKLVGIITQRIPFFEDKNNLNDYDNSGLAIAIPSKIILEMMEGFTEVLANRPYKIKN